MRLRLDTEVVIHQREDADVPERELELIRSLMKKVETPLETFEYSEPRGKHDVLRLGGARFVAHTQEEMMQSVQDAMFILDLFPLKWANRLEVSIRQRKI